MTSGNDWLDQARRLFDVVTSNPAESAPGAEGHGSDCRWCPLCQAAAVMRGERPEVTAALADLLTAAATALRTFSEGGTRPESETPAGDPGQGDGDPPPDVQRIEIA
jgi:hypothetical protein